MAIGEQFAGLPMDQLIGAPLSAAADASTVLANSTADFISRVGFDPTGKTRTVAFMYQRRSVNEDGTSNLDEMKIDVPMLAIVPIPNLQIDEVNILFDMEVKQSEKSESATDISATISGTANFGIFKVSVSGSVSSHSSNTRSSDNSAKYHVDVRATNHGTPEGLARVLDIMAANVAPSLVNSSLKDENGQDLSGNAKYKAEQLKTLRQEIRQIESRLSAARNGLDGGIQQLKKIASNQQNLYQANTNTELNKLGKEDNDKAETLGSTMGEVNQYWNTFQSQAADLVKMLADSQYTDSENLAPLFALKALDITGSETKMQNYGSKEDYYKQMVSAQKSALDAQYRVNQAEQELLTKQAQYSDAIAGKAQPPKKNSSDSQT
ncbi:MAG: DUF2589 domain-containing protein [Clostridium sp.]|jgi:hypothetical protein|nr:DUF2589 domain-containing protein [Clostridium sp.]